MADVELAHGRYRMLVNMKKTPPHKVFRGQDRVQWRGQIVRDGGMVVFDCPLHGDAAPWWGDILGPTEEETNYLMDELAKDAPVVSNVPGEVDLPAVLGGIASTIDHSDDSHWVTDGRPRVEFFNEALKDTGLVVARKDLDAHMPMLTRNTS